MSTISRSARTVFFLQAQDGIRAGHVTGVQTCALPISQDRLLAIEGCSAGPQVASLHDFGDVADAHRRAAARADHDIPEFGGGADLAGRADQILLAIALDIAGADIGVVRSQRGNDLAEEDRKSTRLNSSHVAISYA